MSFMKSYRLSLSAKSYAQLAYLAAMQEIRPAALMESWIEEQWSHRDEKPRMPDIQPGKPSDLPHDSRRPHLAECPAELARIRELYGRLSIGQIAKELGRPKSTVSLAIKRMDLG